MASSSSAKERRAQLKRHPSEVHLRELSNEIGCECDRLGTYLGFKKSDLDQLRLKHCTFEDKVFNMLVNWKQRNYKIVDLFEKLIEALESIHRNDLAYKVQEWREEPHKSRDIVDEDHPDGASPMSGQRPPLLRSFSRLEEVQLRDLSSQIGSEWEKFATFLGLSAIEVYQIKLSHIDAQDRVFEVLIRWQRKMSRNTNMVRTLAKALEDSGRVDLKEKLLEEAGYRYTEEKKKEDAKRDLLEVYNLPPFLGEMTKAYQKIENPTIPFELFMELCMSLDPPHALGNDWRRLADKLNLSRYIPYLESEYKDGPTCGVLWCWIKDSKSLEELAKTLEDMDRGDVALKINTHLGNVPPEEEAAE